MTAASIESSQDGAIPSSTVSDAIRFGYILTELRGRYLVGDTAPQNVPPGRVFRLRGERSNQERRVQCESVIRELAERLQVAGLRVSYQKEDADQPTHRLRELTGAVTDRPDAEAPLHAIDLFLFAWDEAILDSLTARSLLLSGGYQLGIGFAEIRWAPTTGYQKDGDGWYYLSQSRVDALTRLLNVVSKRFHPLTLHALEASLWAWGQVYEKPELRTRVAADEALLRAALHRQTDIWHDLLMGEVDAETLLTPEDVMNNLGAAVPIVRHFRWPLVMAAVGGLCLALFAGLLQVNAPVARVVSAVLAVVGLLGVTAGGITARARELATGLFAQLRNAVYADLVAAAATVLPNSVAGDINRLSRGRNLNAKARL